MNTLRTSLLAAACAVTAPLASAITIDFETASGYTTGVLSGKPSTGTQWALTNGGTNVVNVAAGVGVGGSQGIAGTGTGSGSNFVYYGFNTTNADLGATFDANSSIVDYSFAWRPTQAFGTSNSQSIFSFSIGSDTATGSNAALRLDIRSSGRLIALDGTTNQAVDGLFTLNTYATISGQINYATNTYTLFVNGVQQFTSISGGNLAFNNAASNNAFIRIGNLGGATADYRTWNADNIIVAIPEPSAFAALAGLGALGFAASRRRRRA